MTWLGNRRRNALTVGSRIGIVLVAGASLSTLSAFAVAPVATGSSAGSTSASYLTTLAGFSGAAMYPSGIIWDSTWPGGPGGPTQVIVVADTGYNRISVFDPTQCPAPGAGACTPIETFGAYGPAPGQFNTPRDVAVDQDSNIYVADAANNRIEAFGASGNFLWAAGAPSSTCSGSCLLNTPIGISYDATDNEVLVADTGHSVIKAYAGENYSTNVNPGTLLWVSPSGDMKSPREARRGPDGDIWVADYNDEEVRAFTCTCTTSSSGWVNTPAITLGNGAKGGHGNGELNSPYNVAFSPDGDYVYVADTGNERIAVWNISNPAAPVSEPQIGSRCPSPCPQPPGNEPYFSALRRVTVDPSGNVWGADFWGSGLHEFKFTEASGSGNSSSTPIGEIDGASAPAPGFAEPYGVSVGSDGTTYVMDRLNQRIEEFDSKGTYVTDEGQRGVAAGQYSWPEAVAVAPDKTVWVGDTRNGRLQHFAADLKGTPQIVGTKGTGLGQFNWIEGLSVAANGVVWVADSMNNRIESYDPSSGTFATFGGKGTGDGKFENPEGVAVSATDMYVADTDNNRIEELTLGGAWVANYPLDAPQGVALALDGSLWVANSGTSLTDPNGNDIVHLSSNLTLLSGGFGGPGSSDMEFAQPHSLAFSPNGSTLFVADTYNNRVQEFSLSTSVGQPAQLAFNSTPGGAAPRALLSPQPTVTVEDATGNPVTSDSSTVALAITTGTGASGAVLTCTGGLSVAAVNGVASFSGCSVNDAGTGYTLAATDTVDAISGTSPAFNITTSVGAQKLAFLASPGNAAGSTFNPEPTVAIEDASGNIVTSNTSSVSLAITSGTGASGATMACKGGLTTAAVNGVAQFANCDIDLAGTYTLTATDGTLSPAQSSSFIVSDPTIYRFSPSPIAASGSMLANASLPVTLTADNAGDIGISNAMVYLSFNGVSGGGSAMIGATPLTSTPALFQTSNSGTLQITYTAPALLPTSGRDSIVVQDPTQSAAETNSDSYAFSGATPVVSIGNVDVVEGDQSPGVPAKFTVTISPPQPTAVTVQYSTLCGIGDTTCQEDFTNVSAPIAFTVPANANSTTVTVTPFSYVGGGKGETYPEGWFVRLINPTGAVLGRSIGEGILLPDVESGQTIVRDLYVGDVGLVPTTDAGVTPMYFTVTLGGQEGVAITFNYATTDGTAVAGTDYVSTRGTATIPPGKTSIIITVDLLPNTPPSTATSFSFTISSASGGLTIARAVGTGTILPS